MNTLTARTTPTAIVNRDEVRDVVGGVALSALTFVPALFAAINFAQKFLAPQSAELQQPAAFVGLLICLLSIPFIYNLANKRSLQVVLLGVAVSAFSVGICVGLQ